MSKFSEKGYFVKENAPVYMTVDMDSDFFYAGERNRKDVRLCYIKGLGTDYRGGKAALGW